MEKKVILVDFDRTISRYSKGWQGQDVIDEMPVDGARTAIKKIRKKYKVIVFSSRVKTDIGWVAV